MWHATSVATLSTTFLTRAENITDVSRSLSPHTKEFRAVRLHISLKTKAKVKIIVGLSIPDFNENKKN